MGYTAMLPGWTNVVGNAPSVEANAEDVEALDAFRSEFLY